MDKLFDDAPYIDKNVVTQYDKKKWKKAFQEYCDSPKIREESDRDGLNACGHWFACGECEENLKDYPCARALTSYLKKKGIIIDYKNTSEEYLDKLLRLE